MEIEKSLSKVTGKPKQKQCRKQLSAQQEWPILKKDRPLLLRGKFAFSLQRQLQCLKSRNSVINTARTPNHQV